MTAVAVLDPEELEARVAAAVGRALEPVRAELARLREERAAEPLTMREAAKRLGVSLRTVERRVAAGEFRVVRTGRAVRVFIPSDEG
jgi:excisionase family DNA binding protein